LQHLIGKRCFLLEEASFLHERKLMEKEIFFSKVFAVDPRKGKVFFYINNGGINIVIRTNISAKKIILL